MSNNIMKLFQNDETEDLRRLFSSACKILESIAVAQERKHKTHRVENGHPYVPLNVKMLFEQLDFVKTQFDRELLPVKPQFLDVGCGSGFTLVAARVLGFIPFGIEISEEIAKDIDLFTQYRPEILIQDAMTFCDYNRFDVIYFYRPFSNVEMQTQLERLIEEQMKPGSYLMANFKASNDIQSDPRFLRVHESFNIYKKLAR